MTILRRFTPDGITAFSAYIQTLQAHGTGDPPKELLASLKFSESVAPSCTLPEGVFETRWDLARALYEAFEAVGLDDVELDQPLWTWLACHYFDHICPADGHAKRTVGERPRYVLEAGNHQRYYRHLLAAPYRIYRANRDAPERCQVLLTGAPSTPGEVYEQIAGQLSLVSNREFLEMVTSLYLDRTTRKLKRGATDKFSGGARRLTQVFKQFDLTYDFESLGASAIAELLPKEFARFRREK